MVQVRRGNNYCRGKASALGRQPQLLDGDTMKRAAIILAAASMALTCSAQEGGLVLVRDGDRPISKDELKALREPDADVVAALIKSGYIRVQIDGATLLLVDPFAPPLRYFHMQRLVLESLGGTGHARRFGDLPADAQAAIAEVFHIGQRDAAIPPDTMFGIRADAQYRFNIGGRPVPLDLPLKQNTGKGDDAFLNQLAAHPYVADKPAEMPKTPPPPTKKSSEMLFSWSVEGKANNVLLYKKCAEEVAKLAEHEKDLQQIAYAKARKQLEDANPNTILPDGATSKTDIPAGVLQGLERNFVDNYGAFGYGSKEEAAAAWRTSTLTESGISLFLVFAAGPPAPTSRSFGAIQFGSTGR